MRKLTQKEVVDKIYSAHGDAITVLSSYKNRRTKIKVSCKFNHEWEANPEPLWKGHGCPICAGFQKRTTEEFKDKVAELVKDEYEVLGEYINKDTPILLRHHTCGKEFKMSPNAFILGQRCPADRYKRSASSNAIPKEEVDILMGNLNSGEYKIVGEYLNSSTKTLILHSKCNKTFMQQPTRIIKGGIGCPNCYTSKGEQVIREFLTKNNYSFKEQIRFPECKNTRTLPFDFAIYENEELKTLIEYDGVQHFSPKFGEIQFEQTQKNDSIKNDFCKSNDIPLIRISYVRSENPQIFKEKVIRKLEKLI